MAEHGEMSSGQVSFIWRALLRDLASTSPLENFRTDLSLMIFVLYSCVTTFKDPTSFSWEREKIRTFTDIQCHYMRERVDVLKDDRIEYYSRIIARVNAMKMCPFQFPYWRVLEEQVDKKCSADNRVIAVPILSLYAKIDALHRSFVTMLESRQVETSRLKSLSEEILASRLEIPYVAVIDLLRVVDDELKELFAMKLSEFTCS